MKEVIVINKWIFALYLAREELKQAMTIIDLPTNFLFLANVELELGNRELAEQALDTYQHRNEKKRLLLGMTFLLVNTKLQHPLEHYLLGRYYQNRGELELARKHFGISASSDLPNLYSTLSSKLVQSM